MRNSGDSVRVPGLLNRWAGKPADTPIAPGLSNCAAQMAANFSECAAQIRPPAQLLRWPCATLRIAYCDSTPERSQPGFRQTLRSQPAARHSLLRFDPTHSPLPRAVFGGGGERVQATRRSGQGCPPPPRQPEIRLSQPDRRHGQAAGASQPTPAPLAPACSRPRLRAGNAAAARTLQPNRSGTLSLRDSLPAMR